ncbi:MAG: non-hydrolyzing UDP-N-acetylglucosamine 2-epimerase [Polyangiaceae bacterium]
MRPRRVLVVFGTRPEAIKLAPAVRQLEADRFFDCRICATGQHREMLDQGLNFFNLEARYRLQVMTKDQTLADLTSRLVSGLDSVLNCAQPDVVLVHGDTTTAFAAALSAFYRGIPVAHVEAGLRTGDLAGPFPEEANRRMTSTLVSWHFAPTKTARDSLRREGIPLAAIAVTGNTVVDALLETAHRIRTSPGLSASLANEFSWIGEKRLLLVTGHRRENLGRGIRAICAALRTLARRGDVVVVYAVHLNPRVRNAVRQGLGKHASVHLLEPLDYIRFVYLMTRSYIILTDSGGIQEEAPSLRKPVIVMRDRTERPEAVAGGGARLAGADAHRIVRAATELLDDARVYRRMQVASNPFGDGHASERIALALKRWLANIGPRRRAKRSDRPRATR